MQPEELSIFMNDRIWEYGTIEEIKERRKEILDIMNNDKKGLQFLQKNKLTFALQQNIVKNISKEKEHPKYAPWFALAQKSRNEKNVEEDFKELETDAFKDSLIRVKKRICKSELTDEELNYLIDEAEHQREIQRGINGFINQGRHEVKEEFRLEKVAHERRMEEEKRKTEDEKRKAKESDKKMEVERIRAEKAEKELEYMRAELAKMNNKK